MLYSKTISIFVTTSALSCQLLCDVLHTFCSLSLLCRNLIEVQHIVSVLADWLAPQVHKAKKGARILMRHGYSVKSFAMQWTFVMPIGVSENNDTVDCSTPLSHCHE